MTFEEADVLVREVCHVFRCEADGKDLRIDSSIGLSFNYLDEIAQQLGTDAIDIGSEGCSSCGWGSYCIVRAVID